MVLRVLVDILFGIGIFFIFAGVIGMFRMPDTFCRLQSSTNIVTMGSLPILLGASIYGFSIGNSGIGVKSIIIAVFILLTNPAASHAMTRAAYKSKAKMDEKSLCDEYGRDKLDE
jgi:multicomponent Na+:H+ antiporter subunit G